MTHAPRKPAPARRPDGPAPLRILAWLAVAAVAALSLAPASLIPSTHLPGPSEHIAAYALTVLVVALAYPEHAEAAALALLALAIVFEALQALSPGRTPDFGDAAGSAGGILLGYVLAKSVRLGLGRVRRRSRSRSGKR